jgi:hypothetical protein
MVSVPGVSQDLQKPRFFFLPGRDLFAFLPIRREIHPRHSCQAFQCLRKRKMVVFHDEVENRSPFAAAEAMVELFLIADREAGGFFVVEWAEACEVPAGFLEGDDLSDDSD